jgi:hypothetical protein
VDYPISHFDLIVKLAPGGADGDVRKAAATVADIDGISVAEADYAARVIRLVITPSMAPADQQELRKKVAAVPGITSVSPLF